MVSHSPPRTSFNRSGGNDLDATSLCKQITLMPASLAYRLWQAMINGSANFGFRTRSFCHSVTWPVKRQRNKLQLRTSWNLRFRSRRQRPQFVQWLLRGLYLSPSARREFLLRSIDAHFVNQNFSSSTLELGSRALSVRIERTFPDVYCIRTWPTPRSGDVSVPSTGRRGLCSWSGSSLSMLKGRICS